MRDVEVYAWLVGAVALTLTAAILSNRLSAVIRIPAPALFLIGAALASDLVPELNALSTTTVQRVVTLALVVILFEGGMHIGWRRLRSAGGAVAWVGIAGTAVTAAAVALFAHALLGLGWRAALLLGTAVAPTDPAVVFSVLGRREIAGRSGVILEGESGANDPVGIALMVSLLASTGLGGAAAVGRGAVEFLAQMAVGAAVGLVGGYALLQFMRRVALPSEGLYALRALAGAAVIYAGATVAHGSGFLAVFIAGIMLGDARAPYKREIERFHASLASLAEIVAFTVLGLTVTLQDLPRLDAVWPGLALAAVLAFVIRPVLVGLVLAPVRLRRGERVFVLWSGLKGAVPVLLATFALTSGVTGAERIYDLVFVVVLFSVVVQGALVPTMARLCEVPMRAVEPEPWALGMRFRHEPRGLHHYRVVAGAPADGTAIGDLALDEGVWISLINRNGRLLHVRRDTVLRADDEVLALAETDTGVDPGQLFTTPAEPTAPRSPGHRDAPAEQGGAGQGSAPPGSAPPGSTQPGSTQPGSTQPGSAQRREARPATGAGDPKPGG
jgi:potassium/hydrogen antiporter